jgi:hypothetical protein
MEIPPVLEILGRTGGEWKLRDSQKVSNSGLGIVAPDKGNLQILRRDPAESKVRARKWNKSTSLY